MLYSTHTLLSGWFEIEGRCGLLSRAKILLHGIAAILITPIVLSVFAAGFVWAWTVEKRASYPLFLAGACLLFALGVLSQFLRFPADDGQNALFSGALYTLAVLAVCRALVDRVVKSNISWFWYTFAFLSVMILLWYFFYMHKSLIARVYVQNFGYGLMFFVTAIRLRKEEHRHAVDKIIFWFLIIFAFQFFPRTVLTAGLAIPQDREAFRESAFWQVLQLSLAFFGSGLALSILAATLTDLIEQLRLERDVDSLTGVLNRRGFDERVSSLLGRREADRWTLVLCDIDRFKSINDSYGHDAGDDVLRAFGGILTTHARRADLIGRIGGEEFALLLPSTGVDGACDFVQRLRVALRGECFSFLPSDRSITFSCGIAEWEVCMEYSDVYSVADRRLYLAKEGGRDVSICSG